MSNSHMYKVSHPTVVTAVQWTGDNIEEINNEFPTFIATEIEYNQLCLINRFHENIKYIIPFRSYFVNDTDKYYIYDEVEFADLYVEY